MEEYTSNVHYVYSLISNGDHMQKEGKGNFSFANQIWSNKSCYNNL